MTGKKRSERQAQPTAVATIEKPQRERPSATPTGEYRSAFCPVCGVAHGTKRLEYPERGYPVPPRTQNYWEWISDRDNERGLGKDEPFGVIQEIGRGKGHSFTVLGYFTPEQDKDGFYPLIKARLLLAVKRWLLNGWISSEEIANLLTELKGRGALPEIVSGLETTVKEVLAERKKLKVTELTAAVLMKLGLEQEITDASRQRQAAGMNRKVKAILWNMERHGLCSVRSMGRIVEWLGKD